MVVSAGQTYRKRRSASSGRTKLENRGKPSIVKVVKVVRAYVDRDKMDAVIQEEGLLKKRLRIVAERAFRKAS